MSQTPDQQNFQPVSGRAMPRFAGIKTFFRLPQIGGNTQFDVGILGVPFDGGASYRSGQRFGPAGVRQISSLGRVFNWGRMASFTEALRVGDLGDIATVPVDLAKTYERIENAYDELLAVKQSSGRHRTIFAVGGDHSITLPILRSFKKTYGKPISLVHFDAHLDTYPAAWDCEYHHGSFLRHVITEGLIDAKTSLQIGIRGPLTGKDDLDVVKKSGLRVETVDALRKQPLENFILGLPDFKDQPVYITYDVDCLDPVYAPGTGTPVPGGLTTYETQQILRGLKIKNLIGGDVVEVLPAYDSSEITQLAAMDALFELLGIRAQGS